MRNGKGSAGFHALGTDGTPSVNALLAILLRALRDGDKMWTEFCKTNIQRGDNVDPEVAARWVYEYITGKDHPHNIRDMALEYLEPRLIE